MRKPFPIYAHELLVFRSLREEYGVLLLNTTNMQVQTIAQHCGISDINYFTRIFKKYIGKAPKEYRNSIGS